jgi:hypothetical protein
MAISVTYKACCDICCDVGEGWGHRCNVVPCAKMDGWLFRDRNKLAVCPSCQKLPLSEVLALEFADEFEDHLDIWGGPIYVTIGAVDGSCGHAHRSLGRALDCLAAHQARSSANGLASDRAVVARSAD